MLSTAFAWEYRWRVPILIASQPVLALAVHFLSNRDGCWYAPAFSVATGWTAVVIATLGILLRVQAVMDLHANVMASHGPDVSRIVTTGIYGAVRNPLYISSLLLFGAYGLFFGWLWGIWGLLLGAPLVAIAKVICDRVDSLKPAGELLGQ